MSKCINDNTESSIIKINRTIIAKCITTEKFVNILSELTSEKIYNGLNKISEYNFDIHQANSFNELAQELEYNYCIKIKFEERPIESLIIDFK